MKMFFTILMLLTISHLNANEENWIDMGKYQYLETENTIEKIEVSNNGDSVFVQTRYDLKIYDKEMNEVLKYIEPGETYGEKNRLFLSPDLKSYVIFQEWNFNYYIFHYHLIENDSLFNIDTVLYENDSYYEREIWSNFYPIYWYKTGKYKTYSSYEKRTVYHNVSSMKEYVRRYAFTRDNRARYSNITHNEDRSTDYETERSRAIHKYLDFDKSSHFFYKYQSYEKIENYKTTDYSKSTTGSQVFNPKFIDSDNFIFNDKKQIYIFNLTQKQIIDSIPVNQTVRGLGYHNDNVLFANREMLYYFDITERRTVYEWEIPFNNISTLISTNDSIIYLGISSKLIKMKISDMEPIPVSLRYKKAINNMIIFPNPASDFIEITINKPSEGSEIEIYDVLGNVVYSTKDTERSRSVGVDNDRSFSGYFDYAQQPLRIDVSHLPRGVYFLRIGDRVEKFVKM